MNTLFHREDFTNENFDIVLLIGQSNAEGYGIGPVENEYEPTDNIMQFTDSYPVMYRINTEGIEALDVPQTTIYRITPMAENTRKGMGKLGCLATSFVKRYYDEYLSETKRKVLLIRAAIGGTGFMRKQWTPQGVMFERAIDMTDIALGLNPENKLSAILWHQGEGEAIDGKGKSYGELYAFYLNSLTKLVSDFKSKYKKDIPFLAGGHCDDWIIHYLTESTAITDATKDVMAKFDCAGYVETAGLGSNERIIRGKHPDEVHFNRPSLYELGERYFTVYREIRKDKG